MSNTWRTGWYRFRATFRRRWVGYLSVVLLVGVVGGLALGSVAAARRTQSSFPDFLRTTNPSDMDIDVGPYNPALLARIAHLPQVSSFKTYISPNLVTINRDGTPALSNPFSNLEMVGSLNGLYFDQDRVSIIAGRSANPARPDEVVVNRYSAQLFGLHVGQTFSIGAFTDAQLNSPGALGPPVLRTALHIVGIGLFNDEVIQDDVDRIPRALLTPALANRLVSCCASYAWSGVKLKGGAADVGAVEREYLRLLPPADPYYFHVTSIVEAQGEEAVKPESIALGVFGLIAGLAALVIGGQVISRQIRGASDERDVLRYLGADPAATTADALMGSIVVIVLASLLAAGVAITLSMFGPFGPVRSVGSAGSPSLDWTVLGVGTLALLLGLGGLASGFAYRDAPHRAARRSGLAATKSSTIARAAASSSLPISAVTGVRFALEPGRGRTSVPVRSAMLGALLAVTVTLVAAVFASSLSTLVNTPRLYGWNWNDALVANAGYGDIGPNHVDQLPFVAASSGAYFETFSFDGQAVPVIGMHPGARLQPPLISGHALERTDQVVVGPATLALLHKKVGDTLTARYNTVVTTLHIVGTATMPAVGIGHGLHLSLGTGAVLDYNLIPVAARRIQGFSTPGPNVVFVRFKSTADPARALASLNRVASTLSAHEGGGQISVLVVPVQRPAQIVNYRSMGFTPTVLAGGLVLGSFFALGLTLTASVRRRRREFAVLKTLGFTRRQLASSVAAQASVTVGIGTIIGVPLGILAGRALWDLFAREFYAIAQPTVPTISVVLLAVGALVLANVVAALPARMAARTSTAVLLRTE